MDSETRVFDDYKSARSRGALVRLLEAHQHSVYNICFQVLGHREDAEDASQEVLLKIPGEAAGLPDAESFRRWIHRVSLNAALDARRKRERRSKHEGRAAMTPTPSAPPVDESRQALFEALARLDDENRSLIVEHYFERAPLEDLGRRRGVSSVAIWKRIDRAREHLKSSLSVAGFAALVPGAAQALDAIAPVQAPEGLLGPAMLVRIAPAAAAKAILPTGAIIAAIFAVGLGLGTAMFFKYKDSNRAPVPPLARVQSAVPQPPEAPSPKLPEASSEPRESGALIQSANDGTGTVLGPDGKPVRDVLVFWGIQERGRGDEPFKPFNPNRIKDGVRTDADGRFVLPGTGEVITFFHPQYSIVTLSAKEAGSVKLPPRGSIKGRLVVAEGKPGAEITIKLDRDRQTTTDAEGRFEFVNIEAGVRGLIFPENRAIAMEIGPGEAKDIEIGPGLDVSIDLGDFPGPAGSKDLFLVIGTGKVSSLAGGEMSPPGLLETEDILPGRYWIRAAKTGYLARLTIEGRTAKAEFGSAELEVKSEEAMTVCVVPAGANELLAQQNRRFGTYRDIAPGKPALWTHLPEGGYEIRDRYDRILTTVAVGRERANITLKSR
jgi:RNA polymerase sigma-70 factor (ECF subfamily)